jgi:lipopolysaccharide export system permease protein
MRILDGYIRSSVIWGSSLVILVLLGVEIFIEFIAELPYIGVGKYDIFSVFLYVGMQMPLNLYQMFPIAGFIGSLVGLGRLATTSELIVMRAAGVSIARIGWAVVKTALLMLIVITIVGEWLAPPWQYQAQQYKQRQMGRKIDPWASEGLWLHQGQAFIYVGGIVSKDHIQEIARFNFDKANHLLSSLAAKDAVLEHGAWQLQDVVVTELTPALASTKHYASMPLGFQFEPELLEQRTQLEPQQQTITALWSNIQYRRKAGLLASELESAFWTRLLQPFTTVIMICLGVPFIFGSLRSASMSARILTGIIVGFIFYMLNQFIGPITLVYQWPAWVAGALPTLLFLLIYAALISRIT